MATVDTLKAYETLIASRLPEEQAKAILEVVKAVQESGFENLVTRSDFREETSATRSELKEEISALRNDIKEEMSALRAEIYRTKFDLLKWIITLIIGQGAAVVALLKLLK